MHNISLLSNMLAVLIYGVVNTLAVRDQRERNQLLPPVILNGSYDLRSKLDLGKKHLGENLGML